MLVGVALMAFPYFVNSALLILGIGAGLVGVLLILLKLGL